MLRRLLGRTTSASWVPFFLRIPLGSIFIGHGAQKVFGLWGGSGFVKFISFPAPFPFMKPTALWMGAAAVFELLGGILILSGLFTRVGALLILLVMLTAIIGVHWGEGILPNFFMSQKGIEYPLALLGMTLALLKTGGGYASIDKVQK
ncbi:MAG: DoxX family protein [Pyrinomonadaceae bacterium]